MKTFAKVANKKRSGSSEKLSDGSAISIRPLTPADEKLEREFIASLHADTKRMRFNAGVNQLAGSSLRKLLDVDMQDRVAFVALADDGGKPKEVGVARYARDPAGSSAEIAIVVADAWQHRGVATAMFTHLLDYARSHAVRELYSIEDSANEDAAEFLRDQGFSSRRNPHDSTQTRYTLVL
jgi:N-acetylglutamate synthase-like GNAT family acetyltransferase